MRTRPGFGKNIVLKGNAAGENVSTKRSGTIRVLINISAVPIGVLTNISAVPIGVLTRPPDPGKRYEQEKGNYEQKKR